MLNKKQVFNYFFFTSLSLFFLCSYVNAQKENVVHFGIVTDIQYADKDTKINRYYRNSLAKLDSAILSLNKEKLDFVIDLGDLVDEGTKDLPPVIDHLHTLKAKCYNVLGNHDYTRVSDKDNLYKQLEMPSAYYSFTVGNWLFIVLNTNELSEYATNKGDAKYQQWEELEQKGKLQGRDNLATYNGGVGPKQLRWMEKKLRQAQRKDLNVAICSHHPLYPENGLEALNNRDVLNIIGKYPSVKALFSGHHHAGNFAYYKTIPCVTFPGMVETEQNAFGTVSLFSDKIIIAGSGRLMSRTISIK